MNEGEEIRFVDLFSGIGGFRRGLEKANEERRIYRRQNMHGYCADAFECLEYGREAPGGHISQESPRGGGIGLERANQEDREYLPEQKASRGHSQYSGTLSFHYKRESTQNKNSGFRCVWSCDNNRYANQVYIKNFGEANHYSGDIRGVDAGDIPDFDLLCAGFPCQSFSVAGKGKGFQDTRGTLFYEISRIAEAKRPQILLLENVKGLLSNDRGETFQTILQELGRIGYWVEWQVFNSKHHGVPQNRERVFIIGHLRNGCSRPIFPIGETDEMAKRESRGRSPVQAEVGSAIHSRYGAGWRAHGQEQMVSTAIDGSYYKGVDRHGQRTVVLDTFNRGSKEEEAYSLKTNPSITSSAVIGVELAYTKANMKQGRFSEVSHALDGGASKGVAILADRTRTLAGKGRNLESPKEITNALSGVQKDNLLLKNMRIRRLTPCECERLQGFPDFWTEWGIDENGEEVKISDTQRYKMLGNAVTTSVITFLGMKIMEALK